MSLRHHTILFVPHARARFRKWRVTNRQLAVLGGLVAALLVGSVFTTWSFLTNAVDGKELERIRAENENLRRVNRSFEEGIRKLQKQLTEYEERTRQLAIVAGVESAALGDSAGVGGEELPAPSQLQLAEMAGRLEGLDRGLDRVEERLEERLRWISATPAVAPVKGILTSGFGVRRDPITGRRVPHGAIDIAAAPGQPVRATGDGIVIRAGRIGGLGTAVYLAHGFGITTRYGHLSRLDVAPGQRVERGHILGYVGTTGRSTGYHLHYEVRVDGKPVNPLVYILDDTSTGP